MKGLIKSLLKKKENSHSRFVLCGLLGDVNLISYPRICLKSLTFITMHSCGTSPAPEEPNQFYYCSRQPENILGK